MILSNDKSYYIVPKAMDNNNRQRINIQSFTNLNTGRPVNRRQGGVLSYDNNNNMYIFR